MAVRYSGDVEVRIRWDPKTKIYRGSVRDPYGRWNGRLRTSSFRDPAASESYDYVAKAFIERAEKMLGRKLEAERSGDRIRIMRGFQAPCPR